MKPFNKWYVKLGALGLALYGGCRVWKSDTVQGVIDIPRGIVIDYTEKHPAFDEALEAGDWDYIFSSNPHGFSDMPRYVRNPTPYQRRQGHADIVAQYLLDVKILGVEEAKRLKAERAAAWNAWLASVKGSKGEYVDEAFEKLSPERKQEIARQRKIGQASAEVSAEAVNNVGGD
jgi:hypothetical protein